jgi:hypothetical protein
VYTAPSQTPKARIALLYSTAKTRQASQAAVTIHNGDHQARRLVAGRAGAAGTAGLLSARPGESMATIRPGSVPASSARSASSAPSHSAGSSCSLKPSVPISVSAASFHLSTAAT